MKIAVLKESDPIENRVSATPETVKKFEALGAGIAIESGAGEAAGFADEDYAEAGAA
ncbi:MAG: NAD(P)(+) transhydrogenase (Re/Si-specific) subunit alpha, partial [Parasphingopyxis sp.]